MGKLRGAWAGLSQLRGNFILSEFIFPRRVQLLRPQTSKVFGGYMRKVVDWAPPHTKHSAIELNWGQYMSNLQTQLESDFQWMRPLQRDLRSIAINNRVATFIRINPFFITHGYNTPSLNYNIVAADDTEDRGARTPAEIRNEITRKLREAFDFA